MCPHCDTRWKSSGSLGQHIRWSHTNFVNNNEEGERIEANEENKEDEEDTLLVSNEEEPK